MFSYFLSPTTATNTGSNRLILGLSVSDNVITLYYDGRGRYIPIFGPLFNLWPIDTLYSCTKQYGKSADASFIMFGRDKSHIKAHKYIDQSEGDDLSHYHLEHSKPVTRKMLKSYLNYIKGCAHNGKRFITNKIANHILKQFKKFEKNKLNFAKTSNKPGYGPETTIDEHVACLTSNTVIQKCLSYTPTPTLIEPPLPPATTPQAMTSAEIGALATVAAGLLVAGLFAQAHFSKKKAHVQKPEKRRRRR